MAHEHKAMDTKLWC